MVFIYKHAHILVHLPGDRMYRGEHFTMQLDAHCQFVRHWDTQIIGMKLMINFFFCNISAAQLAMHMCTIHHTPYTTGQWRETHNEMAVLTSYLTDVQGSFTKDGDSARKTRPIMCNRYDYGYA